MKRISIFDIVISMIMLLILAFTLAPAIARYQRSPEEAKCQSNMRRWAQAIALYTSDNHMVFPTNNDNRAGYPLRKAQILLTPDDEIDPTTGQSKRFKYGISWVEALYPYLKTMAIRTNQDWKTFRCCPKAIGHTYSATSTTAYMSYAFNSCLIECSELSMRFPEKTMLLREMGKQVESFCRPKNRPGMDGISTPFSTSNPPKNAFLDGSDDYGTTDPNLHGNGSYIVFADGHVGYFTTEYYPIIPAMVTSSTDPEFGRWYNYYYANPANETEARLNKSIAITP